MIEMHALQKWDWSCVGPEVLGQKVALTLAQLDTSNKSRDCFENETFEMPSGGGNRS
jgi:hypothetical protein